MGLKLDKMNGRDSDYEIYSAIDEYVFSVEESPSLRGKVPSGAGWSAPRSNLRILCHSRVGGNLIYNWTPAFAGVTKDEIVSSPAIELWRTSRNNEQNEESCLNT